MAADDKNEVLLKDIRDTYDYFLERWREIREQGRQDVKCIIEGPWSASERADRQPKLGPKRPCLTLDELSQYLNQAEGNIRQAKRGIVINPAGNGSNDATAALRQGIIRDAEYQCNAVEAYIGAYVSMLQRSYGAFRIRRKYQSSKTCNQVLEVSPFRNPDCVLPDPDAKESDYSDMKRCFVLEPMRKRDFKRRFPSAKVVDFTGEHQKIAPNWIKDEDVLVGEFWDTDEQKRELLMLEEPITPAAPVAAVPGQPATPQSAVESPPDYVFFDELPEGSEIIKGNGTNELLRIPGRREPIKILKRRESTDPFITCYLTNGIEILEKTPWTVEIETQDGRKRKGGRYIPIVFMTGKEIYYSKTDAGIPERHIFSLIRLARDPYMLYCYARTCQAEALGQVPKSTHMGAVGQFEGQEEDWEELGRKPKGFIQYHLQTEETGEAVLPPPSIIEWNPPLDKMELVAEAARRAIQAAIGITGLSSGQPGQDTSARSGIALKTLAQQTYEGNYHFVDAYDGAVKHAGRIMDDLLDVTYETAKDQSIRTPDDKHKVVRINDPSYVDPNNPQAGPQSLFTDVGEHQVSVSTGPTMDSERDAVDSFTETILGNEQILALAIQNPQSAAAKLVSVSIRLKNLGPLGDQLADDISPPDQGQQLPPQVLAQMKDMATRLKAATAQVGILDHQLKERIQEKHLELMSKERIAHNSNVKDVMIVAIQQQHEAAIAFLENELKAVSFGWDKLHESELAPGPDPEAPDDQGLGIHPNSPPLDPNSPQVLAQQAAAAPAGAQ